MKMAKKKTRKKRTKKQQAQDERLMYLGIGFVFIIIGLLAIFKLGFLGILIANVLRFLVGNTFPVMGIFLMFYGFIIMIMGKEVSLKRPKIFYGVLVIYLSSLLFIHAWWFRGHISEETHIISLTFQKLLTDIRANTIEQTVGAGLIGATLYTVTHFLVAQVGTYILSVIGWIAGAILLFDIQSSQILAALSKIKEKGQTSIQKLKTRRQQKTTVAPTECDKKTKSPSMLNKVQEKFSETFVDEADTESSVEPEQTVLEIDSYQERYQEEEKQLEIAQEEEVENELVEFELAGETENLDYHLPPSALLNDIPLTDQSAEYDSIEKNVEILQQTFQSFGVDAKVVRASLGPAVTKYEIQPAVGVKVSRIVGLTDDLALALAAKDIRMEAPIPGKSLIGIEVPNNTVSTVSFRDIIESQSAEDNHLLEVPLGRDISGQVISANLGKMPHLLIAGSTGSGKSVCINGIITSLLMRAKPHEVKLMMIDPKMVELNVYNGIPHLLTPVVTNPRKAAQALQKVVEEMERRYELFAASGVRNMGGYNDMVRQHNLEDGENRPVLPYIVVIVDELADLMMVASNEVEDAIIRLAQMARAAGIHMILATQRPSVDVITGIIKANVPSRIAFAVSSGTDSRTIIDSNGAEKLLGRGDMLFLPMGQNKPTRVQGAFISDSEVEKIVSFVTEQQGADYQENMMPSDEVTTTNPAESQDELYQEVVEMVTEMESASISMIQRRFRVGYNRAARLIDELEANGIVGPSEGSKPRKVLVSSIEIEETE
ncbi:DNA translocase FtsK [Vagococcus lutrae]|uniref:DNA translocase FtsK n=2 Tax=Vagococcus lutrae TaxID=81947 RepID=UPI0023305F4F|nr:DNA translocase FtsK [Vagococcus lutrae]MDT2812221.1 DNA translocase FtsK [Vagococcus lutrae]MDT2818460.1 DNA translocase FtsK [Vagococcus lutrae]MDT2843476.1 DNA translocase FtsK [Vagococcus lutrae]WCG05200.1 DNA translocase FtsK [Vagococcus lutrae]